VNQIKEKGIENAIAERESHNWILREIGGLNRTISIPDGSVITIRRQKGNPREGFYIERVTICTSENTNPADIVSALCSSLRE
jgi:hypothetical protein